MGEQVDAGFLFKNALSTAGEPKKRLDFPAADKAGRTLKTSYRKIDKTKIQIYINI